MPKHVYLSPHLDDVVFSCGGLIFQQANRGEEVLILTICAGEPTADTISSFAEELHSRWEELDSPSQTRKREDRAACKRIGASYVHLDILDAIYRKDENEIDLYPTEISIFGPLSASDTNLIEKVTNHISDLLSRDTILYAPLCFRGHVDHRLTRMAAEALRVPLHYFRDLPYAGRGYDVPSYLGIPEGEERLHPLNDDEIATWRNAIMDYTSQFSTFWPEGDSLKSEMGKIIESWGGIPILYNGQDS